MSVDERGRRAAAELRRAVELRVRPDVALESLMQSGKQESPRWRMVWVAAAALVALAAALIVVRANQEGPAAPPVPASTSGPMTLPSTQPETVDSEPAVAVNASDLVLSSCSECLYWQVARLP